MVLVSGDHGSGRRLRKGVRRRLRREERLMEGECARWC